MYLDVVIDNDNFLNPQQDQDVKDAEQLDVVPINIDVEPDIIADNVDPKNCAVCWTDRAVNVILPCFHVGLCNSCVTTLTAGQNRCPVCTHILYFAR